MYKITDMEKKYTIVITVCGDKVTSKRESELRANKTRLKATKKKERSINERREAKKKRRKNGEA